MPTWVTAAQIPAARPLELVFHLGMRKRWSIILPVAGLALFTVVSYRSALVNRELQRSPNRYFWWSALLLDSDPLDQNPKPAALCQYEASHCANWEVPGKSGAPGWLDRVLVFSSLPAFLAGCAVVFAFGRMGIDEVLSFMVVMPMLLFTWFHLAGRLIDRLRHKRRQARGAPLS